MSEPAVSEPAGPLFAEPLFAEPVLEPLSPPQADLAAVPVRLGSATPGSSAAAPSGGPSMSGAVLLGRTAPEPMAPDLALVELIGSSSAPWQPARPQAAATPAAPPAPAGPAAPAGASTQTRPQTGHVVSGRGVTGRGVVVLILVLTGLVGLVEVALAGHRGAAFAFVFIFTSAVGALVVRRRDLPTSIFAPPLLYCVLITALSVVDTHDQSGGFITSKAVYIGNAFVTGAPTLWTGTVIAAAIVWYRHRAGRTPRS
ncbi:MAG TPA: DUF6542 domain-containing protein [Acidothermaceae bacterium]